MVLLVADRFVAYRSYRAVIPAEICEFLSESQSARLRVRDGAVTAAYLVDALESHVGGCRVCTDLVGVVRVYRFGEVGMSVRWRSWVSSASMRRAPRNEESDGAGGGPSRALVSEGLLPSRLTIPR
jgi:hypothetical protein